METITESGRPGQTGLWVQPWCSNGWCPDVSGLIPPGGSGRMHIRLVQPRPSWGVCMWRRMQPGKSHCSAFGRKSRRRKAQPWEGRKALGGERKRRRCQTAL